jgi:hypothetical protein
MRIPAGITLIVLGAILTFALKGGHIGSLDLHAVGIILMLAGIVGMLLPMLIRNRSRLSRTAFLSRHDVMDDRMDRPGNLGGSDTWEDSESWWHSGSIPRSCVNAR